MDKPQTCASSNFNRLATSQLLSVVIATGLMYNDMLLRYIMPIIVSVLPVEEMLFQYDITTTAAATDSQTKCSAIDCTCLD